MNDRYSMSGPEEGDTADQTVLVIDDDGTELIEVTADLPLGKRKNLGRRIAQLLNQAEARILHQ